MNNRRSLMQNAAAIMRNQSTGAPLRQGAFCGLALCRAYAAALLFAESID